MDTKIKTNIALGILSLALMLLVFVYMPKVSPDLFLSVHTIEVQQGVTLHGKITNAPKYRKNSDQGQEIEQTVVISTFPMRSPFNSAVASTGPNNSNSQPHRLEFGESGSAFPSTPVFSGGNSLTTKVNGSSGVGLSGLSASFKNRGLGQAVITTPFSTFHPEFAPSGEMSNRQLGGLDPGGDPTEEPLPVGDGGCFLILLTIGYVVWKYHQKVSALEQ